MAKFINNRVKSGRVAGSVFAVRYGEVIERAYNPYVANPSTPAQIAQRAKMKLMSQLSAIVAPVLAIPRQGAVSSRNIFVKTNMPAASYQDDKATVNLAGIQLTHSVVGFPSLTATQSGAVMNVTIAGSVEGFNRVVVAEFMRLADGTLEYVASQSMDVTGTASPVVASFPTAPLVPSGTNNLVYLAYGVRLNSEAARTKFADLTVETAEMIANIIVSSSLLESDITLSKTTGIETRLGLNRDEGGVSEKTKDKK